MRVRRDLNASVKQDGLTDDIVVELNPSTPLLFLKNLKILNKFKNFLLSLNKNRTLPGMIQNVVMYGLIIESIFYALSKISIPILMETKW